ncbi:MAG: tRNA preQ1(34) S-adenosylmethionine ribosyltransferase-isomerase QueA [Candidatus Syntrophosphaera sp.]|nr:tRNA preQ1(34) S-adenosylmethionine ribosyltransferase-isomerase QueA [Candidatus Syntrophosphaera sp.]
MSLESYAYHLPPELIAQYPLAERSSSRLLHLDRASGAIEHERFSDILGHLQPGEVLVLNNSKVIPARLFGSKANGARIEILLLYKLEGTRWKCMVHPGKRLKSEQWLEFSPRLRGLVSEADPEGSREIEFEDERTYWSEIERVGHVPLPPYIKRPDEEADREKYQTVYAQEPGSVAAPTAGLHFTPELLSALEARGVIIRNVVLHVGMDTFQPVKCERIDQHKIHSEFCTLPPETAEAVNAAKQEGRRVVAVGSTSVRTLESFWNEGRMGCGSGWTDIFIHSGKEPRVADALITNFHLPKSSLLMMISAFAGYERIMAAYEEAVRQKYRFFSYGDAMYIS